MGNKSWTCLSAGGLILAIAAHKLQTKKCCGLSENACGIIMLKMIACMTNEQHSDQGLLIEAKTIIPECHPYFCDGNIKHVKHEQSCMIENEFELLTVLVKNTLS